MPWRRQQKQHPVQHPNPIALVSTRNQTHYAYMDSEAYQVKRMMGEHENQESVRLAIQAMVEVDERRAANRKLSAN
ncbi:hypothetical protein HDU96_002986 [Phlyctochytrium bullatum]|nr:hypothetical protein HDU96_002986 [Phlyctochytrium bullatum]